VICINCIFHVLFLRLDDTSHARSDPSTLRVENWRLRVTAPVVLRRGDGVFGHCAPGYFLRLAAAVVSMNIRQQPPSTNHPLQTRLGARSLVLWGITGFFDALDGI
jgi:hypothetical protein